MHAIILSAGRGSRLWPLTETIPKCLVKVGGRTILDHQLHALARAGCKSAVVIGGYRVEQVAAHLMAYAPPLPVEVRFNPFWAVSSSIASVWLARDLLMDAFCLLNGDTAFAESALILALLRPPSLGLMVERIAAPASDDMLALVAEGRVAAVSKDLPAPFATHRSLGVVVSDGSSRYRAALETIINADGGIQAYHHDVVDLLARLDDVVAVEHEAGDWVEIDRVEDLAGWTVRAASN